MRLDSFLSLAKKRQGTSDEVLEITENVEMAVKQNAEGAKRT
jgi:hypothetical protein